jgi:hypothetical protein
MECNLKIVNIISCASAQTCFQTGLHDGRVLFQEKAEEDLIHALIITRYF